MKKDWFMRPFRPVHRFGDDEAKGKGGLMSPFMGGEKIDTWDFEQPKKFAIGGGCSPAATRKEHGEFVWPWNEPASPVIAPTSGVRGKKRG
jgi:hypothetical protein